MIYSQKINPPLSGRKLIRPVSLISIIGENDQITVDDWYISNDHKVEGIEASDGQVLDSAGVQALVNAMATFTTPGAGETDLSSFTEQEQNNLTANWQSS